MHDAKRSPYEELSAMQAVFDLMREPAFIVDSVRECIIDVNQSACDALQLTYNQLIGRPWRTTVTCLGDMSLHQIDPHHLVVVVHAAPVGRSTLPLPRDALTGLPTRAALFTCGNADHAKPILPPPAVLFIDLDDFKTINDACGHLIGDQALRLVGKRIVASIRPNDLAVRFGGDEFLVLVRAISKRSDLERLARRIQRQLSHPIRVAGRRMVISASIGIARRERQSTLETLIDQADRAMYRAKKRNRGSFNRSGYKRLAF